MSASIVLAVVGGLVLLLALTFAVSQRARLLLVNVPPLWQGYQIHQGVVFDRPTGLALDIYGPSHATGDDPSKRPIIVFFHGGNWQQGSRSDYAFIGGRFAAAGYLVVVPDYRKYPVVTFPAFVEDAAAALAWVDGHIANYGGDANRVIVMGHSAGAHTAAILAADPQFLAAHGLSPSAIAAVVGLAGPYHFTPKAEDLQAIFGPPARYPAMQISRFITDVTPPMLLLYGLEDKVVGPGNLVAMEAAFEGQSKGHRIIRYPDIDHISIVSALTWIWSDSRPVFSDIVHFLSETVRPQGAPEE